MKYVYRLMVDRAGGFVASDEPYKSSRQYYNRIVGYKNLCTIKRHLEEDGSKVTYEKLPSHGAVYDLIAVEDYDSYDDTGDQIEKGDVVKRANGWKEARASRDYFMANDIIVKMIKVKERNPSRWVP